MKLQHLFPFLMFPIALVSTKLRNNYPKTSFTFAAGLVIVLVYGVKDRISNKGKYKSTQYNFNALIKDKANTSPDQDKHELFLDTK